MAPKDLKKNFRKFAGREVAMIDSTVTHGDRTNTFVMNDPADATIVEMHKEAADNGYTLQLLLPPHYFAVGDAQSHRVTGKIEKAPDGKYRISKNFTIG